MLILTVLLEKHEAVVSDCEVHKADEDSEVGEVDQ